MYTVLLVDDEASVLDMLKHNIDWKDLGVGKVLTATNGQEALERAQANHVALVVADIRMPIMDGLTLVRNLRARSPSTHCILLSAYDDFEYAREAISLGVENYLLKPLALEELEQTVKRALENIYANQSGHYLAYNNMMLRWLTGAISREELADRATHLGINLYLPEYMAVCVGRKARISLTAFCERCHEALSSEYSVYHCRDEQEHYLMVIAGRKLDAAAIADKLKDLAAREGVAHGVVIVLGTVAREATELSESYLSACSSLETNGVFSSELILFGGDEARQADESPCEDIQLLMYERDPDAARARIREYAMSRAETRPLMDYMKACARALLIEYPLEADALKALLFERKDEWRQAEAREGLSNALIALLTFTYGVAQKAFAALDLNVQLALKYIRAEYASGISIREFTQNRGMNAAYLGHVFKRECGVFFNEYLTRVRIAHSVVLLRDPLLKIYDVATRTGFASSSYFVKCFKAIMGVSPAKYRLERFPAPDEDAL